MGRLTGVDGGAAALWWDTRRREELGRAVETQTRRMGDGARHNPGIHVGQGMAGSGCSRGMIAAGWPGPASTEAGAVARVVAGPAPLAACSVGRPRGHYR